jgi:hypothetical protein
MSSKGFRERILEVFTDGSALASSTTETSLLPTSGYEATLGAGLMKIGRMLAFDFSGRISTVVTTPGTLTLALRLGSVDVFSSGAIPLNVVAQTNVHWSLRGELICRAIGTSTTTTLFPKSCIFTSRAVVGSAAAGSGGIGSEILPYNTAPAVGSGFDFSVSQLVDFLATWSVSNASNSITLHCGSVDVYTQ